MKRDREEANLAGLDEVQLNDDDYADFKEAIEQDKAEDQGLVEGGEDE